MAAKSSILKPSTVVNIEHKRKIELVLKKKHMKKKLKLLKGLVVNGGGNREKGGGGWVWGVFMEWRR
ncbi:hypothetical protein Hanom_Chr17g01570921 [Helianthus anomalus]